MKFASLSMTLAALALFAALPGSTQAAVYPSKGQSPQQQQQDEGECHNWAIQQTGYDPANPPAAAAPVQNTTATGSTPGAGARGAARGAVVAGAVGGDSGKGAAAGAVASRSRSRRANAAANDQAQQQAAQQQQAGNAEYQNARAACLEGRGYSVK